MGPGPMGAGPAAHLTELCEKFTEITRFGVMKHLSVLAEAVSGDHCAAGTDEAALSQSRADRAGCQQVDQQVRGQVQLRAGGLEQSPLTWENVKDGWIWILDSMKTLLETGQPLPRVSEDEELASADKPDRAGVP